MNLILENFFPKLEEHCPNFMNLILKNFFPKPRRDS